MPSTVEQLLALILIQTVAVNAVSCIQVLLLKPPLTRPPPIIFCRLRKMKPNKSQSATLKFNALNKAKSASN